MTWHLVVARPARKQLDKAEGRDAARLIRALQAMALDPLSGDIEKMVGFDHKFRRRVGVWRIIYNLHSRDGLIEVTAIVRRSSTTYRHR